MKKRCVVLVAALLVAALFVSTPVRIQGTPLRIKGADERKKSPDAFQTTRAFLNFAFSGQTKAAAELGEPGKSYSREDKINRAFGRLDMIKPPAIVRFLADETHAVAITESVVELRRNGKKREGPLSIWLLKKDNH